MRRAAALAAGLLALPLLSCARAGAPARPPVILISIDTLRADHLPAYGYQGVQTPALDALCRDSILYQNAYAQVPLTLPSHASLFTGLLPDQDGVRDNVGFRLDPEHETLASWLKARGYATGAAVSTFALRRDRGLAQGFDFYDDRFDPGSPDERPGVETARKLETWIAGEPRGVPIFAFFHLYEPHAPYTPPEPFKSRYAGRPYDGEIAAADAAVGGFLEFTRRRGLYDPALIVFLSDHGEGLGDHGEDEHGVFLYREAIRVPLFVKLPRSRGAGEAVSSPVALLDVFPTVAELVAPGQKSGEKRAGVSLLRPLEKPARDRRIYSETLYPRLQLAWSDLASLSSRQYQYIEAPRPELYDVLADPGERNDLAATLPPALRSMRADLEARLRPAAPPETASAEELKRLGSLGYIHVAAGSPEGKRLPDPKDRIGTLRKYKRLFALFYAKQDREVVPLAKEILTEDPAILSVWRMLSASLERLGNTGEAARQLEGALARPDLGGTPEDLAQGYGELAALFEKLGDRSGAERTLREAVTRGVADESVRRRLAQILVESGRGGEALAVLPPASESTDAASLDLEGIALAQAGRYPEARRAFSKALEAEPGNASALFHLGNLSLREGDPAAARQWLEKALAASPNAPATLSALGVARAAVGDERGAFESWTKAVELDPTQYDALFNRSILAGKMGRAEEAARGLERFVAAAPPDRYADKIKTARRFLAALEKVHPAR